MKKIILVFVALLFSFYCRSLLAQSATPTPAVNLNLKYTLSKKESEAINVKSINFSNPTDYTIFGSELTFRCYHEPIVKKEQDGKWTITFKP